MIRKIRTRFYLAVEGESEQSFVKWLQDLSEKNNLHLHLDCQLLNGGGYKTMLKKAIDYRKHKERSKAKSSILLIDSDRGEREDGWSLSQLRQEANKYKFNICLQIPKHEGWLLRMLSGKESLEPNSLNVDKLLKKAWPEYQKPMDAFALAKKFTLEDLVRVARVDLELRLLLSTIGLLHTKMI